MTGAEQHPAEGDAGASMDLLLTAPRGLEALLTREAQALGALDARESSFGVHVRASAAVARALSYQARVPNRVLWIQAEAPLLDAEDLYRTAAAIDWPALFDVSRRFLVETSGHAEPFRDTRLAALKVKDAIADRFRAATGARPDVDTESPDLCVHVLLRASKVAIGIDLVGASMHQRGWRTPGVEAPLKENLAAAMLMLSGWPEQAEAFPALIDPFCGGATLLIEGLWMAAGVPSQWLRQRFAFQALSQHVEADWLAQRAAIDAQAKEGLKCLAVRGYGADHDARALAVARRHLQAARLSGFVELAQADARGYWPAAVRGPGFVVSNPPYGERLGQSRELMSLYRECGAFLRAEHAGSRFLILTMGEELARSTGLRAERVRKLKNGKLECLLLSGSVAPATQPAEAQGAPGFRRPGTEMVYNRLLKNLAKFKRWREREGIECYRLYDADLPEYAAAIDLYGDRVHVQEYAAPPSVDPVKAAERFDDLVHAVRHALSCPPERLYLKQRQRQRGQAQYTRQDQSGEFFVVSEGDARYWVNLADYLDTGLFLDGRILRRWLRAEASGARFLNLFCYTASASVAAALGGASSSISVDLSPNYLEWADSNLELNGIDPRRHRLEQGDVLNWLRRAQGEFDLIYVDPPSFSNSKRTDTVLDIQRDQIELLHLAMARLAPAGKLLFVTNLRRFKLAPELSEAYAVREVSAASIPPDFERNQRIHQAWWLRHKDD